MAGLPGCGAVGNQLDRFVTCAEKATGALGGAVFAAVLEAPFNMLDHAIAEEIDSDHSCSEDPHDVCGDEEEWQPPTSGVVSDEFSQWKD